MAKTGMAIVANRDISEKMPEEIKQADCVYSKPPCNFNMLAGYYSRAGQAMPAAYTTYGEFIKEYFESIDFIEPQLLYIEVTASNKEIIEQECKKRFPFVDTDAAYFNRNRKFKCWIIRCGTEEPAPGSSDIIEVNTYIRRLCKDVDFRCMADPMLHMDAAGFYCNKYEKKFYGIGVDRHVTEKLTTRIEQYEEKQAKKERKRLARRNKQP